MANTSDGKERDSTLASMMEWPTCTLPTNSGVRLIFAGLMGFCYNPTTKKCEVGFYTREADHHPMVMVSEKPGCQSSMMTPGTGRMKIGITNQPSGVCFYNLGGTFNRLTGNDRDIRWMIDLSVWYPRHTIPPGYFAPVLEVAHGTFFTMQKSNSTFKRVPTSGATTSEPYGYLTRYLAADIQVANGQTVTLDTGVQTRVLYPTPQRTYEVLFTNLCDPPSATSDFHLLVEAISSPGDTLYNFYLDLLGNEADPHFCTGDGEIKRKSLAAADDAPCMGAGFGDVPAFPGP